jgi:glycosyltransferase involved in cell wall biosynthesis
MKSTQITAMILTKDEAHRLPLIFKNLEGFAQIIVFDGGSTDDTEKVCAKYGVKFIQRPIEFRPVVGADARFALSQIATPYVLYVNCSHYYPKRLLNEFKRVAEEGKYHAVYHDHVVYSYMRVVHRPFFRRRSSATNFYRVDAVNYLNSVVHNEAPVELPEHLKWRVPAIDEYSVHLFRDYNVKKTESNHSFYADLDASQRFEMGFRTNLFMILWRPCKYFLYQYLRCGSILCGPEGFIYSVLYAQLELNIQIKIWELQNNFNLKFISDSHLKMREKFYNEKY